MITPCCFDDDPSQVRVSCLGNAPAPGSLATGVLAGNNATVTHQLPSTFKARDLTQLCRNRHCRDLRDAAQCLQVLNDFLQCR